MSGKGRLRDNSTLFCTAWSFLAMSNNLGLSYNARKALAVHVGEAAGNEIANLIQRMASQIEELKRSKVNVTPVVPGVHRDEHDPLSAAVDSETF